MKSCTCRFFLVFALFFFPTLLSVGCGKSKIEEEYKIENIHLSKPSLTMQVGDKEQVIAHPVPSVAHQPAFQWSSSDESVATVVNGLVEAVAVGKAVISVKHQMVHVDIPVTVEAAKLLQEAVLYDVKLNNNPVRELQLNGVAQHTTEGLKITGTSGVVKLDKFYALAERMVRYRIKPAHDAKILFRSSEGDFNAFVDVPNKRVSIATNPVSEKPVPFLEETGNISWRSSISTNRQKSVSSIQKQVKKLKFQSPTTAREGWVPVPCKRDSPLACNGTTIASDWWKAHLFW